MWQYNFDYLCHSSHKYIDKIYRNGRWTYIYDDKGKLNRRDTSPNTYANRKADSSLSLNPRALGIVFGGTNPKGHRRTGDADLKNPNTNEAKNARNREIAKSTAATKAYAKAQEVVKAQNARQNEINKGMKLSVSRAQDARQNAIDKSKNSSPVAPKQGLSTKQQVAVNKAVAKSIEYINKTYGTNYGPEAATAAEKERVRRAVEESKDRPAKDQNSREAAIARSVEATRNATQLENARKQEAERRRASNTVEKSQNAREDAIAKSIASSKQVANARKQEYERMVAGSTRRENALRDDPYISSLLNKELKGNLMRDVVDYLDAYEKVYDKVKDDPKVTAVTKDNLKAIIEAFKEEARKRSGTGL